MSKTKGAGSTKNVHDSPGQRLGVKVYGGSAVKTGNIIVRQRGMTKLAGPGTRAGRDFTIYADRDGTVEFKQVRKTRFSNHRVSRTQVTVK